MLLFFFSSFFMIYMEWLLTWFLSFLFISTLIDRNLTHGHKLMKFFFPSRFHDLNQITRSLKFYAIVLLSVDFGQFLKSNKYRMVGALKPCLSKELINQILFICCFSRYLIPGPFTTVCFLRSGISPKKRRFWLFFWLYFSTGFLEYFELQVLDLFHFLSK